MVILSWTVDALEEIVTTLGATYWKFNSDSCQIEVVGVTPEPPKGSESSIGCECQGNNSTDCHVVRMYNSLIFFTEKYYIDYLCIFLCIWIMEAFMDNDNNI